LKINRKGRRGSAKVAEQMVLYDLPLPNIGPILILRRRGSAVSKDGAGSGVPTAGSPFETLRSSG